MNNVFISIIFGLFVFSILGFLAISIYVNNPIKEEGDVNLSMVIYFHETYEENRKQFRRLAASLKNRFDDVEIARYFVKSKVDTDLSIDTVYIPAQNGARKLLIMSSGVHGMEGFTGSAVQRFFMNKVLDGDVLQNMGVLLIHAINPYGFKYERRVSENNVDMNRNFDTNKDLLARKNDGYRGLYLFLNPEKKCHAGYFGNALFFMKTVYYIFRHGMPTLRQSMLQGQYEFRRGIFYGGNDFEPQKEWLEQLILEKTRGYESIFVIDIHTGLGERGKLHFLPGHVPDEKRITLLKEMFRDFQIDWQDPKKDFYPYSGGFRDYIGKLISTDKRFIKMGFEFGTLDSQKSTGSVRSLHNMILENQGFHHGYKNEKVKKSVKKRFREMFFPSSKIWRSHVIAQTSEVFPVLIKRYAELN